MSLSFSATSDRCEIDTICNDLKKLLRVNKPFILLKMKRHLNMMEKRHTKDDAEKTKQERRVQSYRQEMEQLKQLELLDLARLTVQHSVVPHEELQKRGNLMELNVRVAVRVANFPKVATYLAQCKSKHAHWDTLVGLARKARNEKELSSSGVEALQEIVKQKTKKVSEDVSKETDHSTDKQTKKGATKKPQSRTEDTPTENSTVNSAKTDTPLKEKEDEKNNEVEEDVTLEDEDDVIDLTQLTNVKLKYVQTEADDGVSEESDSGEEVQLSDVEEMKDLDEVVDTREFEKGRRAFNAGGRGRKRQSTSRDSNGNNNWPPNSNNKRFRPSKPSNRGARGFRREH